MKKVSIKTIAELSGVSMATVSRVINNRGSVCNEHREKVNQTISKLNYTPNRGNKRIPNIGIIVPMEVPHFSEYHTLIIDGVIKGSIKNNMSSSILIYTKNLRWKSIVPVLRKNSCDGAIVITSQVRPKIIAELNKATIPTMVINEQVSGPKMGFIDSDSKRGIKLGMEYFFSLGHKKIGFLMGVKCTNHQDRLEAYHENLKKAGITPAPNWVADYIPAKLTADSGYFEMLELLNNAPEVTAVVAINDEMAEGALAACVDKKIKVPNEISLLGFDGLRINKYLRPELSTISQPLEDFGSKAIEALGLYLRGMIDKLPCNVCEPELVIRRSCQKLSS